MEISVATASLSGSPGVASQISQRLRASAMMRQLPTKVGEQVTIWKLVVFFLTTATLPR